MIREWNSVTTTMPKPNEPVWATAFNYGEGGATYAVTVHCDHDGTWHDSSGNLLTATVIAWTTLGDPNEKFEDVKFAPMDIPLVDW